MNNIEIIDGVPVDWSKFKSRDIITGKSLESSRISYINLCKLMYSKGHKLLSDYTNTSAKVLISTQCGHNPIKITPSYYKAQNGDIKCPECRKEINNVMEANTSSAYIIGFYNDKIDDMLNLYNCDRVFNNIDELKQHLRNNDVVMLASKFSLYGIDRQEIMDLKDAYNIDFRIHGMDIKDQATKDSKFNVIMNINSFILNHEEVINKLTTREK